MWEQSTRFRPKPFEGFAIVIDVVTQDLVMNGKRTSKGLAHDTTNWYIKPGKTLCRAVRSGRRSDCNRIDRHTDSGFYREARSESEIDRSVSRHDLNYWHDWQ